MGTKDVMKMQTKKQPAQSKTVDMSEVDAYITYLRNHGRKEITLEHYRQNLGRMLRILDADGRPTRVSEIGPEDIAWLAGALQCKDRCKRDYCKQLNAMCNQLAGRDVYAQADLLWNRDTPHRVWISIEQFAILYHQAKPAERLVLVLGAFMGLRRAEMCKIREEDIRDGVMRIHGKGHGEQGLVVDMEIPEPVMEAIRQFREHKRRFQDSGDGYLVQFRDCHGVYRGCCPESLSRAIHRLAKESGIHVTPHSLRRLYATVLHNKIGADYNTIKRLMRHSDISTTLKCYIQADETKERQARDELACILISAMATA